MRIAGPSVAERSRAGCKEQRSAEYWTYSSERRHVRGRAGELCSAAPGAGGVEPSQGFTVSRRPGSARHATPGGYSQQAPRAPNGLNAGWNRELASVWEFRLAPRSGERPTREARRERGVAAPESASSPLPGPLPAFAGRGNRTVTGRRNSWISRQSQTVRCSSPKGRGTNPAGLYWLAKTTRPSPEGKEPQ